MNTQVVEWRRDGLVATNETARLDIARIHYWLAEESYWARGLPRDVLEKAISHSFCLGIFDEANGGQVAFARVVTDYATFSWLCDVYVDKNYRARGLGKWMIEYLHAHPDLQNFRRYLLATRDAQELYRKYGYEDVPVGRFLQISRVNFYAEKDAAPGSDHDPKACG